MSSAKMYEKLISRDSLQRRLVRTAQVRSGLTMLSAVLILFGMTALPKDWLDSAVPLMIFFGGFFAVSWTLTQFYCKPAVPCPHCGKSLWGCGTGNFKPRRMKVRRDATECPNCRTPIV